MTHRLSTLFAWSLCHLASGHTLVQAATGSPYLIEAFTGFNQPNTVGTPCASPCLGFPAGTVVVQPNQFVSSNSAGVYYAVFQADGWTGNLSVTFDLDEAGSVVETMTATGSITSEQAYSPVVLSVNATIPESDFVGPATLTATATATPTGGGAPFGLKSYSTLEVGGAGARRLVQVFVGISSSNGGTGFPCAYPTCPFVIPPGTVVVQPAQFQGDPLSGSSYYSVFQADEWQGVLIGTCDIFEGNTLVYTIPVGGSIGEQGGHPVALFGSTGGPIEGPYTGPATLRVSTTASQRDGAPPFTLTSYAPVQVQ